MLIEQNFISSVIDMAVYEVRGEYLVFNRDITDLAADNIQSVDMQLVVLPFEKFGEYDRLPISQGMAADIVRAVSGLLLGTPNHSKLSDPLAPQPIITKKK